MRSQKISERSEIDAIIRRCDVCNVAMVDLDNKPYVLPMNFGYDGEFLYLHSDPKGKKADILEQRPEVCVSFSTDHQLYRQNDRVACSFSMKYRSALLFGQVGFVEGKEEKQRILNIIMKQYTGREDFEYSTPALNNVRVYRVSIDRLEGKVFGWRETR